MKKFIVFTLIGFVLLLQYQCKTDVKSKVNLSGESLAKIHCASCHVYPDPKLLSKASWQEYILPRMANMMGLYKEDNRAALIKKDPSSSVIYPEEALISPVQWDSIEAFYLKHADSTTTFKNRPAYKMNEMPFNVISSKLKLSPPSSTLVQFSRDDEILIGDAHTQSLYLLSEGVIKDIAKVKEGLVHLKEKGDYYYATIMGSFSPNDSKQGLLLKLDSKKREKTKVLINGLNRPVHSTYGDLNSDGLEDIVIAEFGKWLGQLTLYKNLGNDQYEAQTLLNQTGAIKTMLYDFNKDGILDIVSLFGQAQESMYIHYNKGNFEFESEAIVKLSPSHGSTYFDLIDYNKDGHIDILYTCGDNADFPSTEKPYHGIYIFQNDGNNNFKQSFFFPHNGCYKVIPEDFDLDGDIDFAAISFFPDYIERKNEGFLYLENRNGQLLSHSFENAHLGRWISMSIKDMDKDGDKDLILGSLAFETSGELGLESTWVEQGIPYLILNNTTR
ncbi:MAG: VCBS repeat-containing protein [Bacteroidota bacterium]